MSNTVKKSATQTLAEQLASLFLQRIQDRLLLPGARLPSVRQCARQQGVSPSTVVSAYDMLLAQGMVEARKNRGFYVRERSPAKSRNATPLINKASQLRAPLNATALIRGMFQGVSDKPQPGMGVLPVEWMQNNFLSTAVRKVCNIQSLDTFSHQYGEPAGDQGLRNALSAKLADFSIQAAPDQIITSIGATHALDIVSRTLLHSGDYVMVEDPGWAIEFARLDALGMRILPVPRNAQGPDLEVMERYCQLHSPKMFVSVSVLHNPTGFCLQPGAAYRVLQLAQKYDFHVVEDDTYCHFADEHATRMCALDGLQRTIYVGGFAKVLAPNWRVGYMAAPSHLVERLTDTKLLSALTTPALLEKSLAWCIEQGQLRRHIERVRERLSQARRLSVKLASQHGCTFVSEPAGLFGWVDTGFDTDVLAQRALDAGYLLAPGSLFHAGHKPGSLMRINFATTQTAQFWQVLDRLKSERG